MKQKIVCFKWRGKIYVCLRAFFGGKTMPACFQRFIDPSIRELGMEEEIGAYMDDIMGSYSSKEESIVKAVTVIDKLTESHLPTVEFVVVFHFNFFLAFVA
jgi:hypothetical protein